MKIAKFFNHNFDNGDFELFDKNNNKIYYENSRGFWYKKEFDENNNEIYFENSAGYWIKREYDKNNNRIYFENSTGFWYKYGYDENNNIIYYEDSAGYIDDKRPKSCTGKIVEIDGKTYELKEV